MLIFLFFKMQEFFEKDYNSYCNDPQKISFCGIGVHYGKSVNMTVIPKEKGGVIFKRTDIEGDNEILANFSNVSKTTLNTTISNGNVSVSTIEHFMAALFAVNLRNAVILIDGPEVPLMDGGSSDFIFGLECIKIPKQDIQKFFVKKEIRVDLNDSYITAKPSNTLKIKCIIDFPHPQIGKQEIIFEDGTNNFKEEFSHAKTFGHIEQVKQMQTSQGICFGGDIFSAMVFDDEKIISPQFSYNIDDFVKHKLLDFIGDISLLPFDIVGEFECCKSSHKINNMLTYKIFEDTQLL